MDYKQVVWIISVVLTLIGYAIYIKNMIRGDTKPHIFTRFIRAIGVGVIFVSQRTNWAGAWSWSNAVSAILCFFIVIYWLMHGSKIYIKNIDWLLLILSLWALFLYSIVNDPLLAVVFINISDTIAFIPSIRKSRFAPYTETISLFWISSLKLILMFLATTTYSFITSSNTILRIFLNIFFVIFLLVRRQYVK